MTVQLRDIVINTIIDEVPYYIFWKNLDSVYLGCNVSFAHLVGQQTPEDVIGKTDFDLGWGPGEAEYFVQCDQAVMSGTTRTNLEETLVRSDGEKITMLVSKIPLSDKAGNCVGILGISTNISNIKKTEEELRLAKEKEEQLRRSVMILAGSIAHDLRTPLACVQMYSQVLRDEGGENPKITEILERLKTVCSEMNQTIDLSLKSLTQVVTGIKSNDDLTLCHIWSCVEKTLNAYPFQEGERALVNWNNKNSFSYLGNAVFFYRIIFNLLKNSLYQIHQKRKGEIFIESDIAADNNLLRFKDTAGGVTQQMINNIFSGFNTTKAGGTGVGLAFSQFAMRSIGGDLTCHIVDGDCIEFVLSFPKIKNELL